MSIKREISETLKLAKEYLNDLNFLKNETELAENQILNTFSETEKNVKFEFASLKVNLLKILEKRESRLLKEAEEIKEAGLQPLQQCSKLIQSNIESTICLIDQGVQLSENNSPTSVEAIYFSFFDKAECLGNLPEIPDPTQLPCISFYFKESIFNELDNICKNFGKVFQSAPVQIKSITPKPGSLLVEWCQVHDNDDENNLRDIREFKLQRSFGNVNNEKVNVNFIDCYIGQETQFLLRDIKISQEYSFRICCKFEDSINFSPWSVSRVALTDIPWYTWQNIDEVELSNENKIISLKCDAEGGIFYSDGSQVSLTDTVEFTILEADPKSEITFAICLEDQKLSNKCVNLRCSDKTFAVTSNGRIIISSQEKKTVLPKLTKGSKLRYSLEPLKHKIIRVNVDVEEHRVTYDWDFGLICPSFTDQNNLYFACELFSSKSKVMVE